MAAKQETVAGTASVTTAEKVVKYVGTADERVIEAKDWKSLGIEDQSKVVWNRQNRWTVPASELKENAVRYCDEDDSSFVVTDKA